MSTSEQREKTSCALSALGSLVGIIQALAEKVLEVGGDLRDLELVNRDNPNLLAKISDLIMLAGGERFGYPVHVKWPADSRTGLAGLLYPCGIEKWSPCLEKLQFMTTTTLFQHRTRVKLKCFGVELCDVKTAKCVAEAQGLEIARDPVELACFAHDCPRSVIDQIGTGAIVVITDHRASFGEDDSSRHFFFPVPVGLTKGEIGPDNHRIGKELCLEAEFVSDEETKTIRAKGFDRYGFTMDGSFGKDVFFLVRDKTD